MADQANRARQRTRHNSRKHAIFADIFPSGEKLGEDGVRYLQLLAGLRGAFRPTDWFEDVQVEKLAVQHVRLWRLYKADARIAPKMFARVERVLDKDPPKVTTQLISKEDEVVIVTKDPTPDLVIRYESALERQIGRTLAQLEQWRRIREGGPESADAKG